MMMSEKEEGPYFQIEGQMEDVTNIVCSMDPVTGTNYPLYTYPVNRAFRYLRLWIISKIDGKQYPAIQYFSLE